MYYIAPAVFFAVVLSLPKFLEVEVSVKVSLSVVQNEPNHGFIRRYYMYRIPGFVLLIRDNYLVSQKPFISIFVDTATLIVLKAQVIRNLLRTTDFPAYSDTVYSDTPLTVTLLACPK